MKHAAPGMCSDTSISSSMEEGTDSDVDLSIADVEHCNDHGHGGLHRNCRRGVIAMVVIAAISVSVTTCFFVFRNNNPTNGSSSGAPTEEGFEDAVSVETSTSAPGFLSGSSGLQSDEAAAVRNAMPAASPTPEPVGYFSMSSATTKQEAPTIRCNGLSSSCNVPINKLLFATMHNAMSSADEGILFPSHDWNLEAALDAGVRGINLDVGRCGSSITLRHSFCWLGSRDFLTVFRNIVSFLQENPFEVIIMPTQIDDVDLDEVYTLMAQVDGLLDLLYRDDDRDMNAPWPTLRRLIDINQRIVFFHYNTPGCTWDDPCPPGFLEYFEYAGETPFSYNSIQELRDTSYACEITRGSSGTLDFIGYNLFLSFPSSIYSFTINQRDFLEEHLQNCQQQIGLPANLLIIDFWSTGDVLDVVSEYNRAIGLSYT